MFDPVPEIHPQELSEMLKDGHPPVILDVREAWEVSRVRLVSATLCLSPMSVLSTQGVEALPEPVQDRQASVVVICHHGVRSAQVTRWLLGLGWQDVRSLAGGLEAYARQVDPSIGFY
jgi:rhodanese-related sulfurtransferase